MRDPGVAPPKNSTLERRTSPLPPALAELERGNQAAPAPLSTYGGEGGWGGEDLPTPERQQSYGPMERFKATQAAAHQAPPGGALWLRGQTWPYG